MNIFDIYQTYINDIYQLSKQLCLNVAKNEMYFSNKYMYYLNKYYDPIFNKDLIYLSRQVLSDDFDCKNEQSIRVFYDKHLYTALMIGTYKRTIYPEEFYVSSNIYIHLLSSINTSKSLCLYRYFTKIDYCSYKLVDLCIQKDRFMRFTLKIHKQECLFKAYKNSKKDHKNTKLQCCII